MSLGNTVAKLIVESGYSTVQLLAIRGWFTLILLISWMLYTRTVSHLKTTRPVAQFTRAVLLLATSWLYYLSLKNLPLAEVTILFFVSPFLMAVFSVLHLNEKVGWHRWTAIAMGFMGTVIVLEPGTSSFRMISLLPVGASVCHVGFKLFSRWLASTEFTLALIFYATLCISIVTSAALPFVWISPNSGDLAILFVMALLYLATNYFMLRALIVAEVCAVAPFEYSGIVWAVLLGYLFWGEIPDNAVFLGTSIIVASGVYMIYRERRLSRAHQAGLDKLK